MVGDAWGPLTIEYSQEAAPLGTGGALRHALALVRSPELLALNGDSFCELDLAHFWLWHHQRAGARHARAHARAGRAALRHRRHRRVRPRAALRREVAGAVPGHGQRRRVPAAALAGRVDPGANRVLARAGPPAALARSRHLRLRAHRALHRHRHARTAWRVRPLLPCRRRARSTPGARARPARRPVASLLAAPRRSRDRRRISSSTRSSSTRRCASAWSSCASSSSTRPIASRARSTSRSARKRSPSGACAALRPEDMVFGSYRSHAFYLAKGGDLRQMFAELYGKATGCCGGKAGSMHLAAPEVGFMGASAIVASTIPHAVGAALAAKRRRTGQVIVTVFGDGATEEGVYHESLNFAALHRLPVLFLCENNGLAVHSKITARQSYDILDHADAYGIPARLCAKGNDPRAVYDCIAARGGPRAQRRPADAGGLRHLPPDGARRHRRRPPRRLSLEQRRRGVAAHRPAAARSGARRAAHAPRSRARSTTPSPSPKPAPGQTPTACSPTSPEGAESMGLAYQLDGAFDVAQRRDRHLPRRAAAQHARRARKQPRRAPPRPGRRRPQGHLRLDHRSRRRVRRRARARHAARRGRPDRHRRSAPR